MIELKVNTSFLANYLGISTSRINNYASKSIEEIIKQEELAGNPKARELAAILQKPERVTELFNLVDPENRYLIIKNMSSDDFVKLLPYLDKKDLIWGLHYFTKDKLLEIVEKLPKEELFKLVFQNFSLEDIVGVMPKAEMDKFLESDKISREDVMKFFEQMEEKDLLVLFSKYFGAQDEDTSSEQMIGVLENLDPQKFSKLIFEFEDEDKGALIMNLVQNKPELMMEFQNSTIARPLGLLDKPDILKSCNVLKGENLVKMVEHLPDDLIQVVATQIDPEVFADILISKFSDVLKQLAM